MTVMTINGTDLANWKAKLLEFAPSPYSITNATTADSGTLYPVLLHTTTAPMTLSVTLDVYGSDMADAEMAASSLLSELAAQCEIGGPDGFLYRSILTGASRSRSAEWIVTLSLTFEAVRHKPLVSVELSRGTQTIYCESNVETPCILRLSSSYEESITVQGTLWGTLTAYYMGGTVVIDGISKTISTTLEDNWFSQTDLTRFPSLASGANEIVLSSENSPASLAVTLEYYPTYL